MKQIASILLMTIVGTVTAVFLASAQQKMAAALEAKNMRLVGV